MNRISEKIKNLPVKQHELGAILGLGQQAISAKFRGIATWRLVDVVKIAEALDIPVSYFLIDAIESPEAAKNLDYISHLPPELLSKITDGLKKKVEEGTITLNGKHKTV